MAQAHATNSGIDYAELREYLFYLQVTYRRLPDATKQRPMLTGYHDYLIKFTKLLVSKYRLALVRHELDWLTTTILPIYLDELPTVEILAREVDGVYTCQGYHRRKKLLALVTPE